VLVGVLRVHAVSRHVGGEAGQVVLPACCVVGRAIGCDLVIADRSVSSSHAAIEWADEGWRLRDLGSRNGTIVDNRRLLAGQSAPLVVGSRLQFGADRTIWVLSEATAPELMARQVEGPAHRFGDGEYLVLPDANAPEWSVYQDLRGTWVAERGGEVVAIEDRAVLAVGTRLWRVYLPVTEARMHAVAIDRLRLRFAVGAEEVEVVAEAPGSRWRLAASGRMLLALARRRLADRAAGLAAAEEGWIRQDELLGLLGLDDGQLDRRIHRARALLGKLGVMHAAALVERRSGERRLRIGVAALELG
jgi:hypothetical protein